ncbi:MAG: ABC transporter permease [Clostridia bacterium]|nr:ABC transporter permease [Clostridia bacterium]
MKAIIKKEFKSFFSTPIGFIFLAINAFFLSFYFVIIYSYGSPAIEEVISSTYIINTFLLPVITMRLFSDESRLKTDQVLLTSPVKISGIVLGKFFAAICLYALSQAITVIFEIIILSYVKMSVLPYLYALLGSLLLGAAIISIGMFISSLTESVVIAGVFSLITNIIVIFANSFASLFSNKAVVYILSKIAFVSVAANFSTPVFSIPDIVYFLSIIIAFLFLTVRAVERKHFI